MQVSHSIHSSSSSWLGCQANNKKLFCLTMKQTYYCSGHTKVSSSIQLYSILHNILYSGNKNATVIPLYFPTFLLLLSFNQNSQNRVVLLVSPKWNVTPKSSRCWKISSFVFIFFHLHKSQNRIPLKGISLTVCFKCKTNKFPTRVLRFRFQW